MSSTTVDDIREGSVVIVKGGFGGHEPPEQVTVEGIESLHGRECIDYTSPITGGRWAYLDQIVKVITK